ncbi:hypothetical protein [Streptomyces sp. NPDC047046]
MFLANYRPDGPPWAGTAAIVIVIVVLIVVTLLTLRDRRGKNRR